MPLLALIVPLAAVLLSNAALANDDWAVTLVVFAAITVPVFAGMLIRNRRGALPIAAAMMSCSLIFFAATNFAVWAFNGMYPLAWDGLVACYVAALPFLDRTVFGDLFWAARAVRRCLARAARAGARPPGALRHSKTSKRYDGRACPAISLLGRFCLRMIFSENRFPLFGIMRYPISFCTRAHSALPRSARSRAVPARPAAGPRW